MAAQPVTRNSMRLTSRSQGDGMENKTRTRDSNGGFRDEHRLVPLVSKSKDRVIATNVMKWTEPKFVPYEPYKAAVNPIVPLEIHGKRNCNPGCDRRTQVHIGANEQQHAERNEIERLERMVKQLSEDKHMIESQLKIQTEVNAELKKLLVASVGEDLQARVHSLTEDKTRLAHDIVHYSQKLVEDSEQLEKLSIQCDVWRSKFLASSLMIDELSNWKAFLCHEVYEAKDSLKILLDEQEQLSSCIANIFRYMKSLRDGFDPLGNHSDISVEDFDALQLAKITENLADSVHFRLLGSNDKVNMARNRKDKSSCCPTPGQTFAKQIIKRPHILQLLASDRGHSTNTTVNFKTRMTSRFHPNARFEQLTFNCCGHCKGEIKYVELEYR